MLTAYTLVAVIQLGRMYPEHPHPSVQVMDARTEVIQVVGFSTKADCEEAGDGLTSRNTLKLVVNNKGYYCLKVGGEAPVAPKGK